MAEAVTISSGPALGMLRQEHLELQRLQKNGPSQLGTGEAVGAACKVLSAENTESLPAFEGPDPCPTSGPFPVRSLKEVKHGAAALLSACRAQAQLRLLCPTSACRACPSWYYFRRQNIHIFFFYFFLYSTFLFNFSISFLYC